MADQLFGGVGGKQQTAEQLKHEILQGTSLIGSQQQQQQQQAQQQQLAAGNPYMSLPPPASPPLASPPLMYSKKLEHQNHAMLMQQQQLQSAVTTEASSTGGCANAAAAAAVANATGHYNAFAASNSPNFHLHAPMSAGTTTAASTLASGAVSPPSSQQSAIMAAAAASAPVAGGGYDSVAGASGLGLWGWCFPAPMAGAEAIGTTASTVGVAGGGGDVGSLRSGVGQQLGTDFLGGPSGTLRDVDAGWGSDVWGGSGVVGAKPELLAAGSAGDSGGNGHGAGRWGRRRAGVGEAVVGASGAGVGAVERTSVLLDASEVKRQERNAREQRRSLMTSQQIDRLRQLLLESGIHAKPNKCSVLSEVAEYITQLETRLEELEAERETWIAETADIPEVARRDPNGGAIDCKQVFAHASVALAMATVEGRLMESNLQFEALSGYSKEELKQLTLLSLTAPSDLQDTFGRLSAMLTDGTGKAPKHVLAKAVLKKKETDLSLSLTLVRDALGRPKFFLCSLLPNDVAASASCPSPSASAAPSSSAPAAGKFRGLSGGGGGGSSSSSGLDEAPASSDGSVAMVVSAADALTGKDAGWGVPVAECRTGDDGPVRGADEEEVAAATTT